MPVKLATDEDGAPRHPKHRGLGDVPMWQCVQCDAENTGPLDAGCLQCGAGRPVEETLQGRPAQPAPVVTSTRVKVGPPPMPEPVDAQRVPKAEPATMAESGVEAFAVQVLPIPSGVRVTLTTPDGRAASGEAQDYGGAFQTAILALRDAQAALYDEHGEPYDRPTHELFAWALAEIKASNPALEDPYDAIMDTWMERLGAYITRV